ncbi:MAG: hypothetical protein HDT28_03640 [Clostridiales bacterium]|nr:hypothetical protein [Clostridiales bacterium]
MSNYLTVLKALFKNKLRFELSAKKRSKIMLFAALGFAYLLIMFSLISVIVALGDLLTISIYSMACYFFLLITGALIVLIFGIINLVNTLYLSKDTDFYSMLPIKSSTVFAAKLSFVYISEAAIIVAILLPLFIAFGIVVHAWAAFYIITILTLLIVPALPLVLAAIFAVPVMYIASHLKNRSLVTLIFYIVLFGGGMAVYIYFMFASSNMGEDEVITEETLNAMVNAIQAVLYILYPYTALSMAAFGIRSYGLNVAGSIAVNLLIFIGCSAALIGILMLLGKFMYSRSAKANNQTNDKAKKGEFKQGSGIRSLIKREYISSMRTTQVAFQCYAVFLLPIIFAIMFGLSFGNLANSMSEEGIALDSRFSSLLTFATFLAMLICINNAAATSYSREGTALASLKILPVNAKTVLNAKVLAWTFIAVPVTVIGVIIINAFNFRVDYFLLSLFSFVPLSVAFMVFGALWDLSAPKLKWTDPRQAVKQNLHVLIGQVFGMISGLVLIVLFIVLLNFDLSFDILSAVCWAYIYAVLIIFVVIDILLYRKAEEYYRRIEI